MSIVQIASELGDDDRFPRRELGQARVRFAHFEFKTFRAVAGQQRGWSVSAEREPVAVIFAGKIILERVPFSFRLVPPVHLPDPGQIIRTLTSHEIDNVTVGRDVTLWSFDCTAVPFAVPT